MTQGLHPRRSAHGIKSAGDVVRRHHVTIFSEHHDEAETLISYEQVFAAAAAGGAKTIYLEVSEHMASEAENMRLIYLARDEYAEPQAIDALIQNCKRLVLEDSTNHLAHRWYITGLAMKHGLKIRGWDNRTKQESIISSFSRQVRSARIASEKLPPADAALLPNVSVRETAKEAGCSEADVREEITCILNAVENGTYEDYMAEFSRKRILGKDKLAVDAVIRQHEAGDGPIVIIAGKNHGTRVDSRRDGFDEIDLDDAFKLAFGQQNVCTVDITPSTSQLHLTDYIMLINGQIKPNYFVLDQPEPVVDEAALAAKHGLAEARRKAAALKFDF
ncbi:MAG: hypothetical protein AB7G06_03275 [Bdellovibrionales bacterium]